MPLYEYKCGKCEKVFEQIAQPGSPADPCPHCGANGKEAERLVSAFKVGGRGDLRESTDHGCHGPVFDGHGHDHNPPKKKESKT